MANLGLLIIRLVIGLTFVGHGVQKLFGTGPTNFGEWLNSIGIKTGGKTLAILAGLFEFVGGLLFTSGVFMWFGAILIVIIMLDAIFTVHGKNGYWITNGGFEYNLVLIAAVIGVALIGPGDFALFHKL